jgi:hypothetical protein
LGSFVFAGKDLSLPGNLVVHFLWVDILWAPSIKIMQWCPNSFLDEHYSSLVNNKNGGNLRGYLQPARNVLSILKVLFGISCTASVFTRNSLTIIIQSRSCNFSVIRVCTLLSLSYIENGGTQLEMTLNISLIGIEM